MLKLYTLDLVGTQCIKMAVLQTESLNQLNTWIAFYVNEGFIPFIRILDHYEPYSVFITE